jgi:hypothetical protein
MRPLIASLLTLVLITSSFNAAAAEAKPAPNSGTAANAKKARPLPFHGNIGSVDKQARTIKVGKRTFLVTAETKVTKNGNAATINDATAGEEVGGSYRPGASVLELVSLRIGPKVDAKK